MKTKVSRLILDTNLWISFLLSSRLTEFEAMFFEKRIRVIFSQHLLEEITDVLGRDKIRKRMLPSDLYYFSKFLDQYASFVSSKTEVNICRDPKDNYLLSLAIDSSADFLLTGDKDLLVLNKIGQTHIITYSEWVKLNE